MPRLFVLSGDDLGRTFDFEGPVVLGRGPEASVRLRTTSVSRAHARVEPDPDGRGWRIVDLGSSNGITLGFQRTKSAPLPDGVVFKLGDLEMRFRLETGTAARTPSAPESRVREGPRETPEGDDVDDHLDEDELQLEGDIQLEGDWEDVATLSTSERPAAPVRPAPKPAATPAPAARRPANDPRAARRAAALAGAARAATPAQDSGRGRPVLQYHRVQGGAGTLGADLAQRPWWQRAALWALALGLFAALSFGALELTRKLRASSAPVVMPDGVE